MIGHYSAKLRSNVLFIVCPPAVILFGYIMEANHVPTLLSLTLPEIEDGLLRFPF